MTRQGVPRENLRFLFTALDSLRVILSGKLDVNKELPVRLDADQKRRTTFGMNNLEDEARKNPRE
jgi:hypothetical protein